MPRNDTRPQSGPVSEPLDRWDDEGGAVGRAASSPALVAELDELSLPERQALQCLGVAVVTLWNDLPRDLQRTIFAAASADRDGTRAGDLRGRLARFLHVHKDDGL